MTTKQERRAEGLVLCSAVIEGSFPIVANRAVRVFPALAFVSISSFVGFIMHLTLLLARRVPFPSVSGRVWVDVMGVTMCNSVFALLFIFLGTQFTSGINTALLLQSEMLFSFLIFTFLFGERATRRQYMGAAGVLAGTIFVLYNGSFSLNRGDLLIIFGTMFYPFGNQFAKRALEHLPSGYILMIRDLVGAFVFLALSVAFENLTLQVFSVVREYWLLIVLYGVFVLVGSKLCWYEGLKVLSLTKAISIILSYPVFSMAFAAIFLKEIPTVYQLVGFVVTLAGLSVLISRRPIPSPPPDLV